MDTLELVVAESVEHFRGVWLAGDTDQLPLERRYHPREQAACEQGLERVVNALLSEQKAPPRTEAEQRAARTRLRTAFGQLARVLWGTDEADLALLPGDALVDASLEFVRAARRFDPLLDDSDIEQAARNAGTANGIQHMLGLPICLTPAILGYSLLYPYSDNLLDDPALSTEAKRVFNERFRARLSGESVSPRGVPEQRIFELIGLIEGQFERALYPQVYASLLAIHRAQGRSLRLQNSTEGSSAVDVLGLSLEKGGTSVLADGCLVAGELNAAQAMSIFGLGVFAQMIDDLEDVGQDLNAGQLTLFTQAVAHGPLDAATNSTFHFGARAMAGLADLGGPAVTPAFVGRVEQGAALAVIVMVARAERRYSRPYWRALEVHSPFRLAALQRQLIRLKRPGWSLGQLFAV